jgi:hypothetical protein
MLHGAVIPESQRSNLPAETPLEVGEPSLQVWSSDAMFVANGSTSRMPKFVVKAMCAGVVLFWLWKNITLPSTSTAISYV